MNSVDIHLDNLIKCYPNLRICENDIFKAYELIEASYLNGNKMLIAGNGGSASDSQHFVGELMKNFVKQRKIDDIFIDKLCSVNSEMGEVLGEKLQGSLAAIAIGEQLALSTAYLNDVDPYYIFAQQVYGYGKEGDVFFGITTSGNSKNILFANIVAKAKGMKSIALTGRDGGKIRTMVDVAIVVPENETYKIQELHLPIYHCLSMMLETRFWG